MKYTVYIDHGNGEILGEEVGKEDLKKIDVKSLRLSPVEFQNERFFKALGMVESNNDPVAIGDGGKARGIYQLWKIYVDDVNRIYGTSYIHDDAYNETKAREIVTAYLTYWRHDPEGKCDKVENYGHLAVLHNMGGPEYWKRAHYVSKFIHYSKTTENP
jgi:hypothetical protein